MKAEVILKSSLTPTILCALLKVKEDEFAPVLTHYNCSFDELKKLLMQEMIIPGMTVEVSVTAMNNIIVVCEGSVSDKPEPSLIREIRRGILFAGIYHSNVKPFIEEAVS